MLNHDNRQRFREAEQFDRAYDEHANNHLFSILFVIGIVPCALGLWKAVELAREMIGAVV